MEWRNRTMVVFFLFFVTAGTMPAAGQTLDVCAHCHANATCDDKADGSGKVCNCNYGFVGNGRTFCQDKDECQLGATKICGQHTTCHNTYGSYYCTCLAGYSPSNNMAIFIPNDGTHCKDIDECRVTGLCGEGGQCRNLEGSFECSCQVGYRVYNGAEPFNPYRDKATCKVVDCGQPVSVEDAMLLSVTKTTYGSVATFICDEGFVWRGGENSSVCGADGLWRGPSLVCEATCGPVPFLANSEVVWHNRSIVIHRCVDGYHSWRGSNVSVCGSSGVWQIATLRCIERKPPVNHLFVLNEKCVHWKAEKYEEDTEVYKVTYTGSRDFQRSFRDKRKQFLRSKAEQLELCLNLLPLTNYSISITAVSARFTATITTNTSLPAPPAPVVHYREFETPVPTLMLRRSAYTLDPISLYQVFVLSVEGITVFDCSSPASSDVSIKSKSSSEYTAAQIRPVGTQMNFTVGDGLHYGGFYNAPLEDGKNYYIILRVVSQWKTALKSTCVLWAKVKGNSLVKVSRHSLKMVNVMKITFTHSQAYSGPEDNSTDQHETLTESSTLTFVDAQTMDESAENHSLRGVGKVYLKEFVLIDDDDDGDMSLREKTVTDLSNMDGKAADLVCGRLLSTSSGTVSESKEESPAPEALPPEDSDTAYKKKRCCFCTIL